MIEPRSGENRSVSANGLRRKTQLSRNQSLISHLVSVLRRGLLCEISPFIFLSAPPPFYGTRIFAHGTEKEREKGFDRAFEISSYRPIRLTIPLLLLDIALRHVDTNRRDVHSMDVPISRFTRRLRIRFISIPFSILSPISNWYFMLSRCANKLEMVFQLLAKI